MTELDEGRWLALRALYNELDTFKWMGAEKDGDWDQAISAVRRHIWGLAQGMEAEGGDALAAPVEDRQPGPKDAP